MNGKKAVFAQGANAWAVPETRIRTEKRNSTADPFSFLRMCRAAYNTIVKMQRENHTGVLFRGSSKISPR